MMILLLLLLRWYIFIFRDGSVVNMLCIVMYSICMYIYIYVYSLIHVYNIHTCAFIIMYWFPCILYTGQRWDIIFRFCAAGGLYLLKPEQNTSKARTSHVGTSGKVEKKWPLKETVTRGCRGPQRALSCGFLLIPLDSCWRFIWNQICHDSCGRIMLPKKAAKHDDKLSWCM